ncbi:MAG TPA: sulfite exporter TauE/SafE family protein [Acidimicrobiales bacterium]|nr:sulfite exporter TauE/SafE family protein [Acidimicrobiales bacterium]
MSPGEALAIFAAGLAAGTVNTIVGSGSLITFPTLLAFGYAPVVANVTNTVGLVPGSLSGAYGYRRELAGQRSRLVTLGLVSAAGGLTGGVLLLVLPGSVFRTIVPVLILLACTLVALQPRLARRLARRRAEAPEKSHAHGGPGLLVTVYLTGVYGGYFGAAQGVILIALLGIFIDDDLQRLNAAKNVLAALVNGVAALLFMVASHVAWSAAGVLAVGAILGGLAGATVGRRLPGPLLRGIIVVVGTAVAIRLLV